MTKHFWRLSVAIGLLAIPIFFMVTPLVASDDSGEFDVISYNIHGNLGFGGVDCDKREEMGRLLQNHIKGWGREAILGVQEDWEYVTPDENWKEWKSMNPLDFTIHSTCGHWKCTRKHITLPYQSKIHKVPGPSPFKHGSECYSPLNPDLVNRFAWNDGMNLFSSFEFDTRLYRETWRKLDRVYFGKPAAYKGFSKATLRISDDFEIDVYNLHAGPADLRWSQFSQLTDAINNHSQGKAVIVLGDTNLSWNESIKCKEGQDKDKDNCGEQFYAQDMSTFQSFLMLNGLKSACLEAGSCEDRKWNYLNGVMIDQIMYRGNGRYALDLVLFEQLDYNISDHEPIRARLRWEKRPNWTGLSIAGPDSIQEAAGETYTCLAEYANVTTEAVAATWAIDQGDAHAYLQPLDDGRARLSAHAVDEDKTVTIRCTYEAFGRSITATKDIQIKETGELYSLEIQGPDRLTGTATGTYACIVHWADGSSEPMEATWTVTEGQAYASIEYAEYPKVKLVPKQQVAQEQTVTIRCEFIWAQEKKAITKAVVIYPS